MEQLGNKSDTSISIQPNSGPRSSGSSCSHLEQISVVVVVNENLELLELANVLDHFDLGPGQPLPQLFVVRVRDVEELHAALFQVSNLGDENYVIIL